MVLLRLENEQPSLSQGLSSHMPQWMRGLALGLETWQWIGLFVIAIIAWAIGRALAYLLLRVASRVTRRTTATWDDSVLDALRPPSRFFFSLVTFGNLLAPLALPSEATLIVTQTVDTILIGAIGWTAIRLTTVLAAYLELRVRAESSASIEDRLRARGIETFVRVLRRVISVALGIVTIALMLTRFETARNVGVSMLASAGLASVVLGFAAQRTFGSLIAGIQLSATQPIRIGDVVIIEKEYGTIEEITLTYVVVKIWDERRLIVPMSRFLEHPFENWTKTSAEIHGTVYLHVDWATPIDEIRAEALRLIEQHPNWDGRTKSLQVTGATDRTVEVRVLASASDSGKLWTLRVDVREGLLKWLQATEGGRFLPRVRVMGDGNPVEAAEAGR